MDSPMTQQTTRVHGAIRAALAASLPELVDIDFDAALTSEVGLDSVQIMDLVMEIEDRLDVSISVEALAEIRTLNGLTDHLVSLVGEDVA
jgi:acyl carrier protein